MLDTGHPTWTQPGCKGIGIGEARNPRCLLVGAGDGWREYDGSWIIQRKRRWNPSVWWSPTAARFRRAIRDGRPGLGSDNGGLGVEQADVSLCAELVTGQGQHSPSGGALGEIVQSGNAQFHPEKSPAFLIQFRHDPPF